MIHASVMSALETGETRKRASATPEHTYFEILVTGRLLTLTTHISCTYYIKSQNMTAAPRSLRVHLETPTKAIF